HPKREVTGVGRPERPVDPSGGPLSDFACGLRQLRRSAGLPSYRELARRAHFSASALSAAASGASMPSLAVPLGYGQAGGGDTGEGGRRWKQAARASSGQAAPGTPSVSSEPAEATAPHAGAASAEPATASLGMPPAQLPADIVGFTGRA